MVTYILWSVLVWTFKGLLFTWRFFWISPYHAITAPPSGSYGEGHGRANKPKHKLPLHKRLSAAEDDIQILKNQLNSQRESWDKRFLKLQKRQQDLRNQLTSEAWLRSGLYLKQEGVHVPQELLFEALLENGPLGQFDNRELDFPRSPLRRHEMTASEADHSHMPASADDSRPPSALSVNTNTSVGSWRSGSGPHRVFVPHSPLDLQIGHRVRVLLPSGRISTGTLRYLSPVDDGSQDYHLGVELERADNGSETGVHQGQHLFDCMPGHGAFVPFQKLLMAWE